VYKRQALSELSRAKDADLERGSTER